MKLRLVWCRQAGSHSVEGHSQLAHLVIPLHRHPHCKVPLGKALGGVGHLPQGTDQPVGDKVDDNKRKSQHRNGAEQEHLENLQEEGGHAFGAGRGKYHPYHRAILCFNRAAHCIIWLAVDSAETAHFPVFPFPGFLHNLFTDHIGGVDARGPVGADQGLAVLVH